MSCQHSPDDQTLRLQAGAGENDSIHLPSGPDRVACGRQEEEENDPESRLGLESSRFSLWHFLKLVVRGFSGYSGFLPSFIGLMVQPIK